jgi:hypothetical protein
MGYLFRPDRTTRKLAYIITIGYGRGKRERNDETADDE